MKLLSIAHMFFEACQKFDKPDAVLVKENGAYRPCSHKAFRARVEHFGRGLIEMGLKAREHVAILAETRYEWAIADLGIVSTGAVDVPIYPTLSSEQIEWILNNSDAVGVVVSNYKQYEKLMAIRDRVPMVRFIVMMDENSPEGVPSMKAIERQGSQADNSHEYTLRWQNQKPDDLVTIIYTSGTTGHPKGVMLSNRNLLSNMEACAEIAPFGPEDTHLSHLPLSHVLERMGGLYISLYCGMTIAYAEDISKIADNLKEVRPTILFSVPRLFEKIYGGLLSKVQSGGLVKRIIFNQANRIGRKTLPYVTHGKELPPGLTRVWNIADKMVFAKVKEQTGGNLKIMVAGGAPLAPEIAELFLGMGLNIVEGYGLTESSPVLCINLPENNKPGWVGPPVRGVEIKLGPDNEILARGPNVMMGYYKNDAATAETIRDGWLYTGDIGIIDDEGFVKITDRKKDLIITSGGKNIAPQGMENALKLSPFIEQAVIIGDNRKFISALIVPPGKPSTTGPRPRAGQPIPRPWPIMRNSMR